MNPIIHREFIKTLAMIAKDWHDCANNEIDMQEIMYKAKLSDRITNAILILHTLSVVGYGTRIILANVDITDCTSEPSYIHKMELPFDVNTQRVYKTVVIAQFAYVIMCSWIAGAVNALLLTLVRYISNYRKQYIILMITELSDEIKI